MLIIKIAILALRISAANNGIVAADGCTDTVDAIVSEAFAVQASASDAIRAKLSTGDDHNAIKL